MLNSEDFIKRLNHIFKHYNLTAAMFADEIKVQRSSISHLLSGRNKPSLEFVLKIIDHYQEVSFEWLLNGKGDFPKILEKEKTQQNKSNLFNTTPTPPLQNENSQQKEIIKESIEPKNTTMLTTGDVEKMVVFYKNGTFKEYYQQ